MNSLFSYIGFSGNYFYVHFCVPPFVPIGLVKLVMGFIIKVMGEMYE